MAGEQDRVRNLPQDKCVCDHAFFIFGDSEQMSPVFYIASLIMILAIVANGVIKARKTANTQKVEI